MTLEHITRSHTPSMRNPLDKMWTTKCNGMPTLAGCSAKIVTTAPYVVPRLQKSGWLITPGIDDEGNDDPFYLLAFCPECAEVVLAQEPDIA